MFSQKQHSVMQNLVHCCKVLTKQIPKATDSVNSTFTTTLKTEFHKLVSHQSTI